MMYKTIVLDLIQNRPRLYEELLSSRRLLPAMDAYAIDLKAIHEAWIAQLNQARPGSNPMQVEIEALEVAIEEFLQVSLPSGSEADEAEPLSLDGAMTYIRRATLPA